VQVELDLTDDIDGVASPSSGPAQGIEGMEEQFPFLWSHMIQNRRREPQMHTIQRRRIVFLSALIHAHLRFRNLFIP